MIFLVFFFLIFDVFSAERGEWGEDVSKCTPYPYSACGSGVGEEDDLICDTESIMQEGAKIPHAVLVQQVQLNDTEALTDIQKHRIFGGVVQDVLAGGGYNAACSLLSMAGVQEVEDMAEDMQEMARTFYLDNIEAFRKGWCTTFQSLIDFSSDILEGATEKQKAYMRICLFLEMSEVKWNPGCFFRELQKPDCLNPRLQELMEYFFSDGARYVFGIRNYQVLEIVKERNGITVKGGWRKFAAFISELQSYKKGRILLTLPNFLKDSDAFADGDHRGWVDILLRDVRAASSVHKDMLIFETQNQCYHEHFVERALCGIERHWSAEGVRRLVALNALCSEGRMRHAILSGYSIAEVPKYLPYCVQNFTSEKKEIIKKVFNIDSLECGSQGYDVFLSAVYKYVLTADGEVEKPFTPYQSILKMMLGLSWNLEFSSVQERCLKQLSQVAFMEEDYQGESDIEFYQRIVSATVEYLCEKLNFGEGHTSIVKTFFARKIDDKRPLIFVPLQTPLKVLEDPQSPSLVVGVYPMETLESLTPIALRNVLARMVETREILLGKNPELIGALPSSKSFLSAIIATTLSVIMSSMVV